MKVSIDSRSLHTLRSGEYDDAVRAANAILDQCFVQGKAPEDVACDAVVSCVERGFRSAALVLLLGYFEQAKPLLLKLLTDYGDERVKLTTSSRPVALSLPALLALARLGEATAERAVLNTLAASDGAHRVFVTDVLPYVQSREILEALTILLSDATEIPEDVPSGAKRRRVCDHALEAWVKRFNLKPTFLLQPGARYAELALAEVRAAVIHGVLR